MTPELVAIRRPGTEGKRYEHNQSIPDTDWIVQHGLNSPAPSVTVINSAGKQLWATVTYIDSNTLRVRFSAANSGKVYVVA